MALHRLHAQDRRQAGLPRTLISGPPTRTYPDRHQILHRRRSNSGSDNNWEVQIPLNHIGQGLNITSIDGIQARHCLK